MQEFAQPALKGLRPRLGALVFQISPLPLALLADMPALFQRLATMLHGLPSRHALRQEAPDAVVTVEVRPSLIARRDQRSASAKSRAQMCRLPNTKLANGISGASS